MSEKLITIYEDINLPPVEIVKAILEDQGIKCLIKGYDTMRPYLSYGTGIELQIQEKDKEKAERLIKESKQNSC